MPQRFLRPGITNSERWNAVPWQTQSFFIRILTLVDDFGQYDARPAVLWGQCFQIWNCQNPKSQLDLQQVAVMLQQLAASRLIEIYEDSNGKQFLQVSQWQERVREGCKRKWPNPEKLQQVAASCSVLLPPSSPPTPSPTPSPSVPPAVDNVPENLRTQDFMKAWQQWMTARRGLKKPGNWAVLFGSQLEWLKQFSPEKATEILKTSIRNGWQGLFEEKSNGTNKKHRNEVDRNAGTANEGRAKDYADLRPPPRLEV